MQSPANLLAAACAHQSTHMPNIIRRITSKISRFRGPMSNEEQFLILNDDAYLNQFDEIIVIGDIHGCYEEFKELLNKVHSESPSKNPDKCLKIIVGDLVNKGPKSLDVLKVCRDLYPNSILAVRGNHDESVLKQYENFKSGIKLEPRNKWIETLPSRYVAYLNLLPYTISIPSLNSIIVHAGLEPGLDEPAKTTKTDMMVTMRNIVVEKDPQTNETSYRCTKSNKEGAAWATFWPGPEHVYFGHDARRRLQDKFDFATGLDTGCVYGDSLTYIYIKGPRKGEICSIKAKESYQPTCDTN